MRTRPLVALATTVALATPAAVLAEGFGPHSSYYNQHPRATKPVNDVSIVVHRDKSNADVYVNNFCLGSQTGEGSTKYPNNASARGVKVRRGKISYRGKATIYTQSGQKHVPMRFAATIKPRKATGTAKFPGRSCGTIDFKAKLVKRTK